VIMHRKMRIELDRGYELWFDILDSPIANLWLDRMMMRHLWPLDDPRRFYGFNTKQHEEQIAHDEILQCIDIINRYQPIITKKFTSVHDQDMLNYLHHIFETYHGLLDQQNTHWWHNAPDVVRRALAQLNISVHRCESLRYRRPRIVCTWFGMPKTQKLDLELINNYGTLNIDFGGVYLNYVEIGKTLSDLASDKDSYISDAAFRPFDHYSADFVIYFYDDNQLRLLDQIDDYYQQHRDFFQGRGIMHSRDARALPLKFKVAQLVNIDPNITYQIQQQQMIKTIDIL